MKTDAGSSSLSENGPGNDRGLGSPTPSTWDEPNGKKQWGLLLYLFRQSDNLLINKEIIRQGYGHAYIEYPSDPVRMEEFRAAEQGGAGAHARIVGTDRVELTAN